LSLFVSGAALALDSDNNTNTYPAEYTSAIIMAPSAISPVRDSHPETLAVLTSKFDDTLRFYLNGTRVVLDEIDPEVTVLEYLRGIGLTGTKL
jgi:hypothetical protein